MNSESDDRLIVLIYKELSGDISGEEKNELAVLLKEPPNMSLFKKIKDDWEQSRNIISDQSPQTDDDPEE